ncbi:hypothetical protein PIB30_095510, partial [Stylosanthes scabra]|nr:hypothetical protein [Stylosanthes scabra]
IASISVEGKLNFQVHQAHLYTLKQAYAWRPSKLKAKYEDPRIGMDGVEVHAYAWK